MVQKKNKNMLARQNPFNTSRIRKIPYQWRGLSPSELFSRLEEIRFRGCILGQHGSGKSTLLSNLKSLLESNGCNTVHIFINLESRISIFRLIKQVLYAWRNFSVLLVDGADLLPWHRWMIVRLFSLGSKGIVVTTHDRPMLPILWRCLPEESLVNDIVQILSGSEVPRPFIVQLFTKHSGNLRAILRELYDEYSSLEN
jgi:hypothetical protein